MSNDAITPIRKQYLEIKRQYPNAILFFRLGDFYETFDQDAETVARELDIVLTSRPIGKGIRAPLAGIPYHAVENYLSRLIEKGYHVAICDQVGDQPARGIFPRKVTRVVTPGTILEPGLLHDDSNNYLAALVTDKNRAGIGYVDITTGEYAVTEMDAGLDWVAMRAELSRLHPAEIIHPNYIIIPNSTPGQHTNWPDWKFEFGRCQETLLDQFKVANLSGFGLDDRPLAVRAAGALLQYIKETEPASLESLKDLHVYHLSDFMVLDTATRRNLELTETLRGEIDNSLLGILDQTVTPMGKRLIRKWINQPLSSIQEIQRRQDRVEFLVTHSLLRAELQQKLKPINDIERLTNRILSGHAQPRDMVALRESLHIMPSIANLHGLKEMFGLSNLNDFLETCENEFQLLETAIAENPPQTLQNIGIIRVGYSTELDEVMEASRHAREWINNLESSERTRTGIKTLRVGYNKVFGYYIEVSQGQAKNVPPDYIRKQTLVNAERFITPEMKEYETLVLKAEETIREIELRLFKEVCVKLGKSSALLLKTARTLAELDALASLAEVATLGNYVKPLVQENPILDIRDGRHPVVEKALRETRYIPNDITFSEGEIVRVITGPNMSGKSTYLRQAALIVLMAQMGSFVPASSATIGLVDRIFTRIGAQDEIHSGQSTFMVEMTETANILHHATPRSLLILDEIGRGTSTYDGVSIAWAVIEYIHNHPQMRAKTLFATHYHELTQLEDFLPGVRNYNVAVTEADGKVVFLHKIIPGAADRSYGIHVAQLAGLPRLVVQRAGEIMAELEKTSGRAITINPQAAQQAALFPETSPLLDELNNLDVDTLSPIEALNKLFEMKKKYQKE